MAAMATRSAADGNSTKQLELALRVVTLLLAVFGALWGFYTYKDTKEKEFYTYYWNQKLSLFLETSEAASTMATTLDDAEFREARSKYWELFFGRLSLVEGDRVKTAMEKFAKEIPETEPPELPVKDLRQPAYRLTLELKKELGAAWREPFSELVK